MSTLPAFPSLLQDFFVERLVRQRNASAQTVASYRDTFRLFLGYAAERRRKTPTDLALSDLDAPLVAAFLDHLERERGNAIRTRNVRLTALRSFLRYAAVRDPASLATIQRVLAIPSKRFDRRLLGYLSRDEVEAILAALDPATWTGHRDQAMFLTFYNTGARISEVIALRRMDAQLDRGACLHIRGKGRKERAVPLWKRTAACLRKWLKCVDQKPEAPLFPNADGASLSRDAVEKRLRVAVTAAAEHCPTLRTRRISPHTLRHTTAMHLLQAGVDLTVIALWLGHESPTTTHLYIEADLKMKEQALDKVKPPSTKSSRFRPPDRLLAFLAGL
jgi:site-specific recombinase XerD